MSLKWIAQRLQMGSWTYVSNLLNEPPQTQPQAQEVLPLSIVSTPHAGRLQGGSDRPEIETIRHKTAHVATHCKSATCRSVTWKHPTRGAAGRTLASTRMVPVHTHPEA